MLFGLWRLHCPLAEQCWVNVSNCSEELVVSWLDYILLYCNNQVIVPSLVYFLWCYILPAVGTSVWSRSTLCFKYTVAFSWQCWISVKIKRFHSLSLQSTIFITLSQIMSNRDCSVFNYCSDKCCKNSCQLKSLMTLCWRVCRRVALPLPSSFVRMIIVSDFFVNVYLIRKPLWRALRIRGWWVQTQWCSNALCSKTGGIFSKLLMWFWFFS